MIFAENISMRYYIARNRAQSIKEYIVRMLQRDLQYDEFWALRDVSFTVEKGEVLGIVGRNGAGKSTLLKVISGILKPTSGNVTIKGNIVPMLELGSGFDMELTGHENIFLNGAILGYSKSFLEEKYQEIVEFSELGKFLNTPLRNYSSGMMMRLAFSVATVVNPDILIVDEILAVGDAGFQHKSKQRMMELMKGGTTVLFVSHSIEQIRELCDKVLWLERGTVKLCGDAKEVCDAYENRFAKCRVPAIQEPDEEYAMLYVDTGEGFNEYDVEWVKIKTDGTPFHLLHVCQEPCDHFRFDPTQNGGFILKELAISADGETCSGFVPRNIREAGKVYHLDENDPQIELFFSDRVERVEVEGRTFKKSL
jgi:ABC-type polysaccharide/polyol phosphate transport system ATPase subunit